MAATRSGTERKDAAPDGLVGEIPEPPLDEVEPRARRRREVQVEPRVLLQPRVDVGVAVGTVIIKDQVDLQSFWDLPVDAAQEAQELAVAVPREALAR